MKIVYIITKSNWGGAQRHVFDLALKTKEAGYDVLVLLGGNGLLKEKLEVNGIKTLSITSLSRDIGFIKDVYSLKEMYALVKSEKPDILHLHSPKAAGLGALVGRLLGIKKIILTVHGWTFNEDRPFYQKFLIWKFSYLTCLLATDIITLSQREARQARFFIGARKKIHTIPLGIETPDFLLPQEALTFIEGKIGLNTNKKLIIGTIAELHKNKGLSYAIEAFSKAIAEFPKTLFIIIGEGDERDHLTEQIERLQLSRSVFLLGYVDNASRLLSAFSLFILPSLKEGLPYVLLEAGFAGLPVIATDVGGIPEIIPSKETGTLVEPKNTEALTEALIEMLSHGNKRKQCATHLQKYIEKKYEMNKMIKEIFKLYR